MNDTELNPKELTALALDLVEKESTMALATAMKSTAWAAPVYFSLYKSAFYFFSDPESRHIQESRETGQAAATIYPFVATWQEIRGVQMTGEIQRVSPGLEAIQSIRAYTRKFPFTKEFFKPGEALDLETFVKRFKVRLYKFVPSLIYYLDNKIRFGFREKISL
jgi:uncharacterized protein YhbP (UPF0306 family)